MKSVIICIQKDTNRVIGRIYILIGVDSRLEGLLDREIIQNWPLRTKIHGTVG